MRKPIAALMMALMLIALMGGMGHVFAGPPAVTKPVQIWDADGNTAKVTDAGAMLGVRVDYAHHEIHMGTHFVASIVNTLSNAGIANVIISAPSSRDMHLLVSLHVQGEMNITVFRAPTCSSLGTAVGISNRKDSSPNSPQAEFYTGASCSYNGMAMPGFTRHFGSGQNIGGETRSNNEILLKRNTLYMIRITSESNTNEINHTYDWYEDSGDAP